VKNRGHVPGIQQLGMTYVLDHPARSLESALKRLAFVPLFSVLLLTLPWAAACNTKSDSSPEGALRAFTAALAATREDADQLERVTALLSEPDRRELERRAGVSHHLGDAERTASDMLVLGRIQVAWVPRRIKVTKNDGRRAELAVTGPDKQRARVKMVHEPDGWRVSLGLAAPPP
jgi:hypothetical protein